ncbi:ribulokinase [Echinicola strongylocentroti]|uniref:Ribulokinase n=1 Tax=Echinicola strongylocentroti TaxID=1795355 RepID=A0A2Z4IDI4_9BACT|nr:ribulokinase [Echinicola strongylocentroti]AWW28835.1 ribulokinase [Echinicola strongylocentroti]
MPKDYVIGVDFGTDSVRSILVDTLDGEVLKSAVYWYPRWSKKFYCDADSHQFRQDPLDHLEGLEYTVSKIIQDAGIDTRRVKGIGIDTTGSSPIPVDENGDALSMSSKFSNNPNAMVVLWKDHTAVAEAEEITKAAKDGGIDYTAFSGGNYSSEWFWAKVLSVYKKDSTIAGDIYTWMEHCDFIVGQLTGERPLSLKRSRTAAGHKAMWNKRWSGLPPASFWYGIRPELGDLREKLYEETYHASEKAGTLCLKWADKLGLSVDTAVAVGTLDAHAGAVGAGISPNTLVKVIGTSTCDILVGSPTNSEIDPIEGICGQVEGAVLPGTIGFEAGQAGFGDVLAWFAGVILEPSKQIIQRSTQLDAMIKQKLIEELEDSILDELSREALDLEPILNDASALDWINGRRSPFAKETLKGAFLNLHIGTKTSHMFRAMVEALCFGSKKIIDHIEGKGLSVEEIIAIGGVANKSPLVMQTMADIIGKPIKISASKEAPALGSAIHAAVASNVYSSMDQAVAKMVPSFQNVYSPNLRNQEVYIEKYKMYEKEGSIIENLKLNT